jgi:hypothetical protein
MPGRRQLPVRLPRPPSPASTASSSLAGCSQPPASSASTASPSTPDFTVLTGGYCLITILVVLVPMLVLRDKTIASPITMLAICVFITMPVRFPYLVDTNRGQGSLCHRIAVERADYRGGGDHAFAFCLLRSTWPRVLLGNRPATARVAKPPRVISVPCYAAMGIFCLVISVAFALFYLKAVGFSLGDIDTLSRKRGAIDSGESGCPSSP